MQIKLNVRLLRAGAHLIMVLVHPPDHSVYLVLPVSCITSFNKVGGLLVHATTRGGQFERPEIVVCILEVLSNSVDLMDEILNADDSTATWKDTNDVPKS